MNGEDILKGMNYIDEKFIGPAAPKRTVRRKIWVRWTAAAACFALLCVGLFQWLPSVAHASQDLMEQIQPNRVTGVDDLSADSPALLNFSTDLFATSARSGGNVLVSPVSALYALAMTANGAGGETRSQMETVLGLPVEKLNVWLYSFRTHSNEEIAAANAIWIKDTGEFVPEQQFLQTNADYYGAGVYAGPFNRVTCDDINSFVEEHTNGRIERLLEELYPDEVMCLVNALSFDAKWSKRYFDWMVKPMEFTTQDGQIRTVEMMCDLEETYLSDGNSDGFIKYYTGKKYAFVALLPKEGVDVTEYAASLTGDKLRGLLDSAEQGVFYTGLPVFTTQYSADLAQVLQEMGMTDAFTVNADFLAMGNVAGKSLYISRSVQKNFLKVDLMGTQAAAASANVFIPEGLPITTHPDVILDRPFVYMILDCHTQLPLFMGVMADPGQ